MHKLGSWSRSKTGKPQALPRRLEYILMRLQTIAPVKRLSKDQYPCVWARHSPVRGKGKCESPIAQQTFSLKIDLNVCTQLVMGFQALRLFNFTFYHIAVIKPYPRWVPSTIPVVITILCSSNFLVAKLSLWIASNSCIHELIALNPHQHDEVYIPHANLLYTRFFFVHPNLYKWRSVVLFWQEFDMRARKWSLRSLWSYDWWPRYDEMVWVHLRQWLRICERGVSLTSSSRKFT